MTRARTPTRRRLLWAGVLAALLAACTTGCGSDESLGGIGLPTLSPGEHVGGALVPFEGVVHVDAQGCLMVDVTDPSGDGADRWAVWPDGAQLIAEDDLESGNGALVHGQRYVEDDPITGTGRLVALEALPGGGQGGGYFRGSGGYCGALEAGVLVIDDVQPAAGATSAG